MTTSLNVELVHVILVSIQRFSGTVRPDASHYDYNNEDLTEEKTHLIDSIKIGKPELWKVN